MKHITPAMPLRITEWLEIMISSTYWDKKTKIIHFLFHCICDQLLFLQRMKKLNNCIIVLIWTRIIRHLGTMKICQIMAMMIDQSTNMEPQCWKYFQCLMQQGWKSILTFNLRLSCTQFISRSTVLLLNVSIWQVIGLLSEMGAYTVFLMKKYFHTNWGQRVESAKVWR